MRVPRLFVRDAQRDLFLRVLWAVARAYVNL